LTDVGSATAVGTFARLRARPATYVAASATAVTAVYAVFATYSPGPVLYLDSMGYIGNARAITGAGAALNFDYAPFTAAGYSFLLVPAYLFTTSPHAVFVLALAVNVVAGASISVAGYLLARSVFDATPLAAALSGTVAALYPSYLLESGQVWPEVVLAAIVCWWAVALTHFLRSGAVGPALACGAITGSAWAVHRRMSALVLVTGLAIVWAAWRRRVPRAQAVVAIAVATAVIAATAAVEWWLRDVLWSSPPLNENSSRTLLSNLSPEHWGRVALNGLGEAWYLSAASFCVVVLGVVAFVGVVGSLRSLWRAEPAAVAAAAAIASFAGTILIGALFGVALTRADQAVYGRYVDEFSGVLLVAATAAGFSRPRRLASLAIAPAVLVGSAAVIYGVRGHDAFVGDVQKLAIPGLLGLQALVEGATVFSHSIRLWGITALAAALFAGFALLAAVTRISGQTAAAIAFLTLALLGERRSLKPFVDFWNDAYGCVPVAVEAIHGQTGDIAVDLRGIDPNARNRYQYLLPGYRFEYFDSSRSRPPAPLVLALQGWRGAESGRFSPVTGELVGAEVLWREGKVQRRSPVVLASGAACPTVAAP
jgi:hypothetical protein